MSVPILPEDLNVSVPRRMRVRARPVVGLSLLLCFLPPRVLRWFVSVAASRGRRPAAATALALRAAVVSVSSLCAGEGCLPRSVATTLLARTYGYTVTWCTGVKDAPFAAHAWIEVDGQAIGEPGDVALFRKMLISTPKFSRSEKRRSDGAFGRG